MIIGIVGALALVAGVLYWFMARWIRNTVYQVLKTNGRPITPDGLVMAFHCQVFLWPRTWLVNAMLKLREEGRVQLTYNHPLGPNPEPDRGTSWGIYLHTPVGQENSWVSIPEVRSGVAPIRAGQRTTTG